MRENRGSAWERFEEGKGEMLQKQKHTASTLVLFSKEAAVGEDPIQTH